MLYLHLLSYFSDQLLRSITIHTHPCVTNLMCMHTHTHAPLTSTPTCTTSSSTTITAKGKIKNVIATYGFGTRTATAKKGIKITARRKNKRRAPWDSKPSAPGAPILPIPLCYCHLIDRTEGPGKVRLLCRILCRKSHKLKRCRGGIEPNTSQQAQQNATTTLRIGSLTEGRAKPR